MKEKRARILVFKVFFYDEFVVNRKKYDLYLRKATGQNSQGWAESQDRVGIGDYCSNQLSVVSGASKGSLDKVGFCEIILPAVGCEQRKLLFDNDHIVKSSSAREKPLKNNTMGGFPQKLEVLHGQLTRLSQVYFDSND